MKLGLKFAISLQILALITDRLLFKTTDPLSVLTQTPFMNTTSTELIITLKEYSDLPPSLLKLSVVPEKM
jgi:hypothetical protein